MRPALAMLAAVAAPTACAGLLAVEDARYETAPDAADAANPVDAEDAAPAWDDASSEASADPCSPVDEPSPTCAGGVLGHLAVIGGEPAQNMATSTVFVATIDCTGNLDQWRQLSSPGLAAMTDGTAGKVGSFVAIAGEIALTGNNDDLYYTSAPVADAAPWQQRGGFGIFWRGGATARGRVYFVGGQSGATALPDVDRIELGSDGAPVHQHSGVYPVSVSRAAVASWRGRIYVMGGVGTSVRSAPTCVDGAIGSWRDETALPDDYALVPAVVFQSTLHVLGGPRLGVGKYALAPVRGDGTLGAWTSYAPGIAPRAHGSAVVYGDHVYAIGGDVSADAGSPADVWIGAFAGAGNPPIWQRGPSLPAGRMGAAVVAY